MSKSTFGKVCVILMVISHRLIICVSVLTGEIELPMRSVIATGGSVIYREATMMALRQLGLLVYTWIPHIRITMEQAIARRVAVGKHSGFESLYAERAPLYEKWAEVTLDCYAQTPEQSAETLNFL